MLNLSMQKFICYWQCVKNQHYLEHIGNVYNTGNRTLRYELHHTYTFPKHSI